MGAIGRFAKLNVDIQKLADKIMEDQDLCKLIYHPHSHPLTQHEVNGEKDILDKRLLLFTPKIPLAGESKETDDDGTYVMIRPFRGRSTRGGHYIISLLMFDIYCQKDIRTIYYKGEDGSTVKGDRALLIMDKIENTMKNVDIGIGKDNNMDDWEEVANRNTTFSGYRLIYLNTDFRKLSR